MPGGGYYYGYGYRNGRNRASRKGDEPKGVVSAPEGFDGLLLSMQDTEQGAGAGGGSGLNGAPAGANRGRTTDYGAVIIPPTVMQQTIAQLKADGGVEVLPRDPEDPVPMTAHKKPSAVVVPLTVVSVSDSKNNISSSSDTENEKIRTPQSTSTTRAFRFCDAEGEGGVGGKEQGIPSVGNDQAVKGADGGGGGGGGHGSAKDVTGMLRRRSSTVREKWGSKVEFLLAVIGFAVDLGNVWRFPYICYRNGGGAFLIPYMITYLVAGLPLFYMELALGQFHRSGCISIWKKICPIFKGIGFAICITASYLACFYNTIIAHAVFFFFDSFRAEVPWKTCNNSWNTDSCAQALNASANMTHQRLRSPAEEYFMFKVLESQRAEGLHNVGGIKGSLAACLVLVFIVVYFALWKGPRSSGKAVWITATMPYAVLLILLVRGVTLPGAMTGIEFYLTPNFTKIFEKKVWAEAAVQIFFSLGPGFGVLLALSSYNEYNNNCYRDAVITSLINGLTSFLSGFVIFSTLGYMSVLTNTDIAEVAGGGGPGLIFIVYPQAIATMQYSSVYSLLFFFMLFTLGIDSTFGGLEAIITAFCDEFPRTIGRRRELFVLFLVILYYCGSLSTVTYGGEYVIEFLDKNGVEMSLIVIVTIETYAVCWFYGVGAFCDDVHSMLGFRPGIYWRTCWYLCPVSFTAVLIAFCSDISFMPHAVGDYTYPWWSVHVGWLLRLSSIIAIPLCGFYVVKNISDGPWKERFFAALKPIRKPRRISYIREKVEEKYNQDGHTDGGSIASAHSKL